MDSTHLTVWNGEEYVPVFLKGVNLGVSVPGTFPGQLAATSEDYRRWFEEIHAAGFNCIRLYTLHFPRFYDELKIYNEAHPQSPLYFFQGVWLEEEVPNYDHDLYSLSSFFHGEMKENVRAVHGDITIQQRFGKAHGAYSSDVSPWCLGYITGREIYPEEVLNANANHPSITSYNGVHLQLSQADPAEVWLTAHLDSLVQFELAEYGTMRPVSASSWPTLDPLDHPTETHRGEDTAKIDLSHIDFSNAPAGVFISYHAYPYYPDFISATPQYRTYSDEYGMNSYLGYLTELRAHYPTMPVIIAEYGVPSSWGVAHYSASGMNHGGQTEEEQGQMAMRMLGNIETSGCGGGMYFAWIDEWFKSTWVTDPLEVGPSTRILWPNYTAAEQNFGLMGWEDTVATWTPFTSECSSCDVHQIYTKVDVGEFQVYLETNRPFANTDTLWIALDTYGDSLGEILLPDLDSLDIRAEFLLKVFAGSAELYVMRSYDLFGIWHNVRQPDQLYSSTHSATGDWRLVSWKNNSSAQDVQYIGNLKYAIGFQNRTSLDAVVVDTNRIHIRLPWTLLQFVDPSHRVVFNDDLNTPGRDWDTTAGVRMQVILNDESHLNNNRIGWNTWNVVTQVAQVPKRSYEIVAAQSPNYPDFTLSRTDYYDGIEGPVQYDASEGVLANDEQWNHGEMTVVLDQAPTAGFLQLNSDGSFTYMPSELWNGSDEFTYKVYSLGDVSEAVHVHLRGLEEIEEPLLVIGPNPATEVLHIESRVNLSQVDLFHSNGEWMIHEEVNTGTMDLNVSALSSGTYVLRVMIGEDELYRKITIL